MTRAIPTSMEAMIAMIVVMIVVTILFVVEASNHMLPVVCIMSIPSGVIGMMLMIHPVLMIV